MMYFPVQTTITPRIAIRRERLLPAPGEVLVRTGDLVGPTDVVARCSMPGKIYILDVSRSLRVSREQVSDYVRKDIGDLVRKDEVLALPSGLVGRLKAACKSPVDGTIVDVRDGLVLIESSTGFYELVAHLSGQITNVMPNWGVVISTTGALIQGVWGSGGEATGVIKMVVDSPGKPLRARSLDVSCQGTLVVGGWVLDRDAIQQAKEAQVRGIIAGGVDADLAPLYQALSLPVMVTEGFGHLPMSDHTFELLNSNLGREAMLSAGTRPEVIIPRRLEGETPVEDLRPARLSIGMRVRVSRDPYLGVMATLAHLPDRPRRIESGATVPVAELHPDGENESIFVPLANLERIG